MRIGQIPEALKFTKAHEQHIRKTEPNFLSYFSSWASNPDRRLSKTLRDRFLAEYNQRTREVSGAEGGFGSGSSHATTTNVEIQRKNVPVAIASMEDWIWLQLVLVKETDPALDHPVTNNNSSVSSTHDRYGLEEFAQVIAKYGESHFDPNGNRPLMYFRVLLMSGQFEKVCKSITHSVYMGEQTN
jgi:nuclear pore complex protein Nup93